jgi:hypothetical protein
MHPSHQSFVTFMKGRKSEKGRTYFVIEDRSTESLRGFIQHDAGFREHVEMSASNLVLAIIV